MSEDVKKDILKAIQDAQNNNTQGTNGNVVFHNPKVLKQTMAGYEIHYIWIPCEKRLPDDATRVLVTLKDHTVTTAWWNGHSWANNTSKKLKTVIAWTPFPGCYRGD